MRRIARLPNPAVECAVVARTAASASARRTFCAHAHARTLTSSSTTHASTHAAAAAARPQLCRSSPATAATQLFPARRLLSTETKDKEAVAEAAEVAEAAVEADAVEGAYLASAEPVLVLPGETETAPRPTEIADSNYQPAASAEGLETVGGIDGWWEDDAHWDDAVELRGFGPRRPVTDAAVLQVLARRAVLEAVAVQQLAREGLAQAWGRGGAQEQAAALALEVDVAADGSVAALRGDAAKVVQSLRVSESAAAAAGEAGSAGSAGETAAGLTSDEARSLLTSWDPAWKSISLADPLFKFTVVKRIFQLTGQMMPDAQLATVDSVAGLLAVLVRPPKAKKLAEELALDGSLASLPNVAVYGRRVTPIDRHKMVGRWKVIVEELEKRGLPVTGTGGYSKAVERKWAFH